MPLVEQELPTLPEHRSSTPVFSGVRVTRSLVLCVCLSFCTFSFDLCVVCSSSFDHVVMSVLPLLTIVMSVLPLLTIVLSVLLRFTDSHYPFGIIKLFYILYQMDTKS